MPHLTIEYSANIGQYIDMADFCDTLRKAAIETGALPMAGVRVRAFQADFTSIADGHPGHGFLDISLRLRGGRDTLTKQTATAHIFETARAYMAPAMEQHSIALSFEMRDIDPELSPKTGTIRDHLNKG